MSLLMLSQAMLTSLPRVGRKDLLKHTARCGTDGWVLEQILSRRKAELNMLVGEF
jgi:hypothetical protein